MFHQKGNNAMVRIGFFKEHVSSRLAASAALLIWVVLGTGALAANAAPAASRPGATATSTRQERSALVAPRATSVRQYFIAVGDNGKSGRRIGCGDSLVAVKRPIPPTKAPL